jgi:hypothetical protein
LDPALFLPRLWTRRLSSSLYFLVAHFDQLHYLPWVILITYTYAAHQDSAAPLKIQDRMPTRISDKVHRWCTATPSVSDSLAVDPTIPPGQAAKKLFNHDGNSAGEQVSTKQNQQQIQPAGAPAPAPSPSTGSALPASDQDAEDLERAFQCGRFGETRPSDLFLKMFHDALLTLEHDPLNGVVSPCLMGSTGVIPLSGIGVVWDICRHMVCSSLMIKSNPIAIRLTVSSRISSSEPKKKSSLQRTTGVHPKLQFSLPMLSRNSLREQAREMRKSSSRSYTIEEILSR